MMSNVISSLTEPGALALIALIAFACAKFLGTFKSDRYRKKLVYLSKEIMKEPNFNRADKAWLRNALSPAVKSNIPIVAIFAPLAVVMAFIVGLFDSETQETTELVAKSEHQRLREKIDNLEAGMVKITDDIDPRDGKFWDDPRRKEIKELSDTVELWESPLATMWVFLWLGLAVPFVLIGILVKGSISPFIRNLWDPIRSLIPAFTRTVDKLNVFAHR